MEPGAKTRPAAPEQGTEAAQGKTSRRIIPTVRAGANGEGGARCEKTLGETKTAGLGTFLLYSFPTVQAIGAEMPDSSPARGRTNGICQRVPEGAGEQAASGARLAQRSWSSRPRARRY